MPLAAGFGDGSGVRNSKTRLNLHQSSRGVIVRRVNPLPASPKVARAWQPLGCGPKSRWDLKAAQGAALVVVALSGWCVFPEYAGPTGLKILFWLDNLQRCRAAGAGVLCHAGWEFGCVW